MEPFPSSWRDTPKSREQWARMQRNEAFMDSAPLPLKCYICGILVRRTHWSQQYHGRDQATVDHIQARANGGSDNARNLAICCRGCNQAKGHT